MKMKKLALACGVAMLGMSAQSIAEVSMNLGATSNYIWRGVTQTDDRAAISGGVDWAGATGLYAGAWASNVDFGEDFDTSYELDLYGGYANEVGDFGYDLGLIYYVYDSDDELNFLELALSGSWKMVGAGINYTASADDSDFEGSLYYFADVSFDLPQDFSVGGVIGRYDFDPKEVDDYTHYGLDLSRSVGDYGDVTLSVSDTDIDDDDYRFFVSWAKTF